MAESSTQSELDVRALVERGDTLLAEGRVREAAAEYSRAVELAPEMTGGHLGVAKSSLALGSYNYVYLACQKVLQLAPDSADGAVARALLFVLERRYDAAVTELERAEQLAPGQAYVHALRGYCLRRLGNKFDAQSAESKAARLSGIRDWSHLFPQADAYPMANGQAQAPMPAPGALQVVSNNEPDQQRLPQAPRPWSERSDLERRMVQARALVNRRPVVTITLVLINVAIYLICVVLSQSLFSPLDPTHDNILYDFGFQQGSLILQDPTQAYRILTAMFLHENIVHIGFNMWSLYVIGVLTERIFNSWRFTLIYFASGIIAGLTQALAQPNVPALGASGAIFGIFGAFGAFILLRRDAFGPARGSIIGQWVFFLVLNLVFSFTDPSIALYDHLGGLISGFILGAIFVMTAGRRSAYY